jgi:hypothetical protein
VVFMWFRLVRREVEFVRDAELGILPDDEQPQPESGRPERDRPQEKTTA